jgi:hypothetical protein
VRLSPPIRMGREMQSIVLAAKIRAIQQSCVAHFERRRERTMISCKLKALSPPDKVDKTQRTFFIYKETLNLFLNVLPTFLAIDGHNEIIQESLQHQPKSFYVSSFHRRELMCNCKQNVIDTST